MMTVTVTVDARAEQRDRARHKANAVRTAKAGLKREIKSGQRDVRDVLWDPPACCLKMTIVELLTAMPRVGDVLAHKIAFGICRPDLRLSQMSDTTRGRLAGEIEARAWWALPRESRAA